MLTGANADALECWCSPDEESPEELAERMDVESDPAPRASTGHER